MKILSTLDHPNVVKMIDAVIDSSAYYIIMEYIFIFIFNINIKNNNINNNNPY